MTEKKASQSDREFVERLGRLDDEIPVDKDEVVALLREANIDAAAELKRTLAAIAKVDEATRAQKFEQAERQRLADLARLEAPKAKRKPAELRARLAELKAQAPAELLAFHRNFESASDEDLETLVAEFEELLSGDKKDE